MDAASRVAQPATVFLPGREVCVVGGGNTASKGSTVFVNIASKVTLVHRRDTARRSHLIDKLHRFGKGWWLPDA
jgi:thioredoxin reductase